MPRYKLFKNIGKIVPLRIVRSVLQFLDYYVLQLLRNLEKKHFFLYAAGIAYSLLLSTIPITLLSFSILGNFIDTRVIQDQITKLIETIIPYPEYAEYTKQIIIKRIPQVIVYKTAAAYAGGFGLFFTSTWLFNSMRITLNRIFGVSEEKSEWIGLLRDFGMVLLLILFILLSTFVIPTLKILINSADKIELLKLFRISQLTEFIFSFTYIIVIFIMFYIFYYLIPYEKLGKKIPAVAAFWATLLWELARNLFGYYVSHFLSANKLYGAFLLIIVIVFWLFYSSLLFVVGAEIGQLYREKHKNLINGKT